MEGKRFIHRLRFRNLLSFGPAGVDIELEPLTVLIGPNASGKSNVLASVSLLPAAADDLGGAIREGGGIHEWIWKGPGGTLGAGLDAVVTYPDGPHPLYHELGFSGAQHPVSLDSELVVYFAAAASGQPILYGRSGDRPPVFAEREGGELVARQFTGPLAPDQSVLSQRSDPQYFPELHYLAQTYGRIRLYRDWQLGRLSEPRRPQAVDLPSHSLLRDASNVALVWNLLENWSATDRITEELRRFHPPIRKITSLVLGGTIQLMLHEEGLREPIPASRWSDGTLRYLCLLTVLCHPQPPPLVCIEEPELGLHPDIIPRVAELLVEASSRMQLIVTTHSSELVDALSDTPEAVVVCERSESGTRVERLEPEKLKEWLGEYTLGHLWMTGHLGGTL
jgi:predicted ATPase